MCSHMSLFDPFFCWLQVKWPWRAAFKSNPLVHCDFRLLPFLALLLLRILHIYGSKVYYPGTNRIIYETSTYSIFKYIHTFLCIYHISANIHFFWGSPLWPQAICGWCPYLHWGPLRWPSTRCPWRWQQHKCSICMAGSPGAIAGAASEEVTRAFNAVSLRLSWDGPPTRW